jgi:dTDP-4-dehydrorhamnose 3,5-epimerase
VEFRELSIRGVYLIRLESVADERGFFARAFCEEAFAERGLCGHFVQTNLAYTERAGTIRGLHYQLAPHEEVKLVRCIRGAVWDVCVDLRKDSSTYGQWLGEDISAENRDMLYVPAGCAHGYQALRDDTEVLYSVSSPYALDCERGVRWDDPVFGIEWKYGGEVILSDKDASWKGYRL